MDENSRRFSVYRKADMGAPVVNDIGGFPTYAKAKEYADSLDYPTVIFFNWQGEAHAPRRTKADFEFATDSGQVILLKWERTEYRAYNKRTGQDLKLGATVPDGLLKYLNKNF